MCDVAAMRIHTDVDNQDILYISKDNAVSTQRHGPKLIICVYLN